MQDNRIEGIEGLTTLIREIETHRETLKADGMGHPPRLGNKQTLERLIIMERVLVNAHYTLSHIEATRGPLFSQEDFAIC